MFTPVRILVLAVTAATALAACSQTSSENTASTPVRTGSSQDEGVCLEAVTKQTQNTEVTILSSEFSEAATLVMVGVGADRAPWRCLVSGGTVTEVMSMTDEGRL